MEYLGKQLGKIGIFKHVKLAQIVPKCASSGAILPCLNLDGQYFPHHTVTL